MYRETCRRFPGSLPGKLPASLLGCCRETFPGGDINVVLRVSTLAPGAAARHPSTCRARPGGCAMSGIEGEWINGEVASSPTTSTGCKVMWQTFIERKFDTDHWADYKPEENMRLDVSFLTGKRPVTLGEPPNSWTVDLNRMVQVNDKTNTTRPIRRIVIVTNCLTTD